MRFANAGRFWCWFWVLLIVSGSSGCAVFKPAMAGASVSVANYTEEEIVYARVEDLKRRNNMSGDSGILPYGGGGIVCCYGIPEKWQPGLQALVTVTYGKKDPDDAKEENRIVSKVVPIGPYRRSDTGQIWILIHPGDDFELVVFNGGPNSEDWTGKVKGGPVWSKNYAIKVWQRDLALAKQMRDPICSKAKLPPTEADYIESWKTLERIDPASLTYSGPGDEAFRALFRAKLTKLCATYEAEYQDLLTSSPR